MKKIIVLSALFIILMNSNLFSQSYIGSYYNDFFTNMLNAQKSDGNDVVGLPSTKYYNDGSYNVTIKFSNTMIACYTFDDKNMCIQIYQFIPLTDRKDRKDVKKSMEEEFSKWCVKQNGVWVERRKNGVVIEHQVEDSDISGIKGIIIKSYFSYLK